MPRPPKPVADRLVTVSVRLHPTQVAYLDRLATRLRRDRSTACRALLALGGERWERGERPELEEL